jgi:hypothetical protein
MPSMLADTGFIRFLHATYKTIELHVQRFFAQALQLDPLQLRLEAA